MSKARRWTLLRFFLVATPALALPLQSFLQSDLMPKLATPGTIPWVYWWLRIGLFAALTAAVLWVAPTNGGTAPSALPDRYGPTRRSKDPLLGIRAFACLAVICGHWFFVWFPPMTANAEERIARSVLGLSPAGGVWIFFALSGYLMAKGFVSGRHNVSRQGLRAFFRNRVLRVAPVYYAAIALMLLIAGPARPNALWVNIQQDLPTILLDSRAGGPIAPLWSITTEFEFYLLVPFIFMTLTWFLMRTGSRSQTRVRPVIAVVAVLTIALLVYRCYMLHQEVHNLPGTWLGAFYNRIYFPLFSNFDTFMIGFATAYVVRARRESGRYYSRGMLAGTGMIIAIWLFFTFTTTKSQQSQSDNNAAYYVFAVGPTVVALLTAAAIYCFETAARSDQAAGGRGWKLVTRLGLLTFCVYVVHEPVMGRFVPKYFANPAPFWRSVIELPVTIAVVLIIATFMYKTVEERFDSIKANKSRTDYSQQAAPEPPHPQSDARTTPPPPLFEEVVGGEVFLSQGP